MRTGPSAENNQCVLNSHGQKTHSEVRLRNDRPHQDLRLTCLSWQPRRLQDRLQSVEGPSARVVEPKQEDRRLLHSKEYLAGRDPTVRPIRHRHRHPTVQERVQRVLVVHPMVRLQRDGERLPNHQGGIRVEDLLQEEVVGNC